MQAEDATAMPQDELVTSAIAHWAPRFVANGVVLTDFEEVTASITSWDEWCGAWSARAALHEGLGREALAHGNLLTAGEHLQRAGVYYHFGKFLFVHDLPQMQAAHLRAVACRALASPHLRPPGERVEMPYEGKRLAGILRRSRGGKADTQTDCEKEGLQYGCGAHGMTLSAWTRYWSRGRARRSA